MHSVELSYKPFAGKIYNGEFYNGELLGLTLGPRDMGVFVQERTLLQPKNLDYSISFRHGILITRMCGVIFKGLGFLENQIH